MTPEQIAAAQTCRLADTYMANKTYKPLLESFEKSLVAKSIGVDEHLIVQLGKQFDAFETYKQIMEANGSLNTLGEIPKVALDIITATMSNTILPVIATTQVIEAQKQLVYFKNLRVEDTAGNVVALEKITDPLLPKKTLKGYSGSAVVAQVGGTGDGIVKTFTVALGVPVRSQFIKIYVEADPATVGQDVGTQPGQASNLGTIFGKGVSGIVNYDTGSITLDFFAPVAAGKKIFVDYQVNLEQSTDIRRITQYLDQVMIEAEPYALKSVMGMFQAFALKKQFGDSALDDMTMDLTREINAEIGGKFISQYSAAALGVTQFSLTAPASVSEKLHRESYAFRMADAEAKLIENSGRGTVKVMIVGYEHAALVRGLDGFQLLSDGNSLGAHIFGTYKGVTYIRVPEQALLDKKAGIGLYTGASPLESAGVYAPFMPLTVVPAAQMSPNPLNQQMAAATMCGTKVVVPQYATKFNIVP